MKLRACYERQRVVMKAGLWIVAVILATSVLSGQQRGGSSSSNSYGSSSNTRSSSSSGSSTYGSSGSTYGTSSSSYGSSSNTYGTSSNTYGSSPNTYGSSSNSRISSSVSRDPLAGFRTRSPGRLYLPIWLRGRVMVAGGEPAPDGVPVMLSCGGTAIPQGYTDRKGRYSFQPGCRPVAGMADASVRYAYFGQFGSRLGIISLQHCWLYAPVPGYRSSHVMLGVHSAGSIRRLDPIVLERLGNVDGHSVSATTLMAPKDALRAYKRGRKALESIDKPNLEKAARLLEEAIKAYPQFAAAWEALGRARSALGDLDGAHEAFKESIAADSMFLPPYESIIDLAFSREDWAEVEYWSDRHLKRSPASTKSQFMSGYAASKLGNLSKAESRMNLIKANGDMDAWPTIYLVLGAVYEARSEFEEAAELYRSYLKFDDDSESAKEIRRKLKDWTALWLIAPKEASSPSAARALPGEPPNSPIPVKRVVPDWNSSPIGAQIAKLGLKLE